MMIENKKSITMDHVKDEVLTLVESLIVKLQHVADREETLEYTRAADEYICAITMTDNFHTYRTYSDYALNKTGLTSVRYKDDKHLIPNDKRDELVVYQREYVLATYVEKNNYYRTLAGLPNYGEEPLYLEEYVPDVDMSKPLHEMDDDDITILKVTGILEELMKKYPDKKYLDHLEKDRRIPIQISRKARPYSILYIKRDRSKQGVSDMFIGIYNQCSEYIQERFYEESYKHNSPYYDGFIGMFILAITIQRYITNYFHKFINRDFYDKDIIKLFLESYEIPYFDEIPLSYMQKVAKNLNRLLMYKSTDKVFTDIFKIFDLDNIDIYNYILFKDRKLDALGNPIEKYQEKTELGYYIETETYQLVNSNDFTGFIKLDYNNVKNIAQLDPTHRVVLFNNGIVRFEGFDDNIFKSDEIEVCDGYIEYKAECNFKTMQYFRNLKKVGTIEYYAVIISESYEIFTVEPQSISHFNISSLNGFDKNNEIESVLFTSDNKRTDNSMNKCIVVNYKNHHSDIYLSGSVGKFNILPNTYSIINTFGDEIKGICVSDIHFLGNTLTIVTKQGSVWAIGNNENNKLMVTNTSIVQDFILLEKAIDVKECRICQKGLIFVINEGIVRYTGSILPDLNQSDYLETNIIYGLNNISRCNIDPVHGCIEFMEYTNRVHILGLSNNSNIFPLIYENTIENPEFKFKYVKDLVILDSLVYVTCYKTKSELYYSGENKNRQFPFIKTKSFVNQLNDMDIDQVEIFDNMMYFIAGNKLYRYEESNYREIQLDVKQSPYIQRLRQFNDNLYVICGTKYVYQVNDEEGVKKLSLSDYNVGTEFNRNIIDLNTNFDQPYFIFDNFKAYSWTDSNKPKTKLFEYNGNKYEFRCVDDPLSLVKTGDKTMLICVLLKENITQQGMKFEPFKNIHVNLPNTDENINSLFMLDDKLIIDSTRIYCIDFKDLFNDESLIVLADIEHDLHQIRAKTDMIDQDMIIYDRTGGIIVFNNFKHLDRFECDYVDTDYITLYTEPNVNVKSLSFSDTDVVKIQDEMEILTYEPIVNDMYNLRFVEAPISTTNLGAELSNNANYLDYELVVYDDKLWGGDVDQNEFVKEILNSEFNYVYSKYISVNSRYNLTQLNFELCYMFRMLVDLKENEKYLSFDVPYVGEVNLFDCIVGLFAITCLKFGFDGNIMDTTTKSLSVLGFNFNQDMEYLTKVVNDAKLYERDPNFKMEDIEIFKAPKLFKESPEVINLYLDNRDIMDNIYKYKYNAKTIQEYNAYKRIEYASVVTNYSTDMYKIDGVLPKTYMDYLAKKNINLYQFIKETNPENMVQQIDILLVSLDTYMKTDKFKYLFLNVPSLSMDNIRKFIYYLVDIFKSYTVDLKALNIIYHVDDKRIHNIKLILEEENFYKIFEDYDKIDIEDFINYTFNGFTEFERVKLKCIDNPNGNLPLLDFMLFNNKEMFSLEKTYPIYESLREDFADFFEEMNEILGYEKALNMVHNSMMLVIREFINKKMLNKDDFKLYINIAGNDLMELVNKEYRDSSIEFKSIFMTKLIDNLAVLNTSNVDEFIKLMDLLINSQTIRDLRDIIPFDMYDNLEYIDSINQHDNKINYKDRYYFIRKD